MFIIGDNFDLSHQILNQGLRGCLERDFNVQPLKMRTVQFPLIDMDEWPERIAEMEAKKSRSSDIRKSKGVKVLDQNGQGFCHTEDTEVLTEKGFVRWPEYNWNDKLATVNPINGTMEYQSPTEKHIYEYSGEMIYSKNKRVDFGVTPDHEMYVRKWDENLRTLSPDYNFVKAKDLGWYTGLMSAPKGYIGTEFVELEIPGDRKYSGDDFLALLGLIISDGYAGGTENTKNWVSFASFRGETLDCIRSLANRVGFNESPSRKGVFIRYDAGALASWIRSQCYVSTKLKSQNKCIPLLVKESSSRQIKHFLHYFDDRNRDGTQFYTTSRKLADDIQELHMKIGKRSCIDNKQAKTVKFNGNKSGEIVGGPSFVVTVSETDSLCLDKKKHIETDKYKGLVYCAGVPNHTLITRRNGTSLISSNCWAYSTVQSVQITRAKNNLPTVALSAHSVACKIKNFRDEGAWGALSLEFISKNGIVPVSHWPEKSMSRQYDNDASWNEAKKYRVDEQWVDLASDVWDRTLTKQQIGTQLLLGNVGPFDYNWWGHSVCGTDLVDVYKDRSKRDFSRYGVRITNSWTDGWGDGGEAVLADSKAWPDGATFVLSVIVS